ncbi:class I SAM-dependent methyltransferase [Paracoccus litorisediminis]|nr:class I SAM-dependent methyltransferase [Paracoccus litorisediminis]
MNFQLRLGHSEQVNHNHRNVLDAEVEQARAVTRQLTRRHYSSVLELGCSPVTAAADLARRADRFLALDDDPRNVEAARARLICRPQARVRHASVPRNWPRRAFDLIVISEMIARLNRFELRALARRCAETLSDCGELILFCDLEDSRSTVQRIAAAEEFRREFGRLRQLEITRHAHARSALHLTILARGQIVPRAQFETREGA